jgi:signal transduction histidine kinase/DNA-binding NarL/FixJ family response regulator
MSHTHLRTQRKGVLFLGLLLAGAMLGGVISLVSLTWVAVNREVSARETELVRHSFERTATRIQQETSSAAEWDEAYRHTRKRDLAWMRRYFSAYFRTSFGHDLTLVLDENGEVVHGAYRGSDLDPSTARALAAAALPRVREVQLREVQKRQRPRSVRDAETTAMAQTSMLLDAQGQVYLVGLTTILPSTFFLEGREPAMVVVSGRHVDRRFLGELQRDLGIVNARLTRNGPRPGEAAAPLARGGSVQVAWTPAEPGEAAIRLAARPILLVMLIVAGVCGLLFWRLLALLRSMAAQDRALQETLEDLRAARDGAEAASVTKSRFIANISHEIRTPLNGVLGMVQAMQGDDLSDIQQDRLQVIRESGETLLAVLNDVLDLSKIEAGKLELEMGDFDLRTLASGAHAAFTAVAERKGLDFSLTIAPEALGRYRSDGARIRQILYNLISNALKFTAAGAVRVRVDTRPDGLRLQVADSGIGISKEVQSRLFQVFEQADASTTRRFGGSGLGLAICRELTVRLGGEITVSSAPGQGSTFTVDLPMLRIGDEIAQAAPASAVPTIPERPLRVLAAEDNPVNQLVLRTLLHQMGVDHEIVENGEAAIEAWRTSSWDAVLMDVQMPVLDGPAATRRIRTEEARCGRPRTPIIALTANAMTHQVAEYLACGMDAYVSKPIDVAEFMRTLVEAVAADALASSGQLHTEDDQALTAEPPRQQRA